MIRPIRVDHTNFFKCLLKLIHFFLVTLRGPLNFFHWHLHKCQLYYSINETVEFFILLQQTPRQIWCNLSPIPTKNIRSTILSVLLTESEMGAYLLILRRTPDHEDLVTLTDIWLTWRSGLRLSPLRTFLVKAKEHRGESLNLGGSRRPSGRRLEVGEGRGNLVNYRWKVRTTRLVYPYYDRSVCQWKIDT